MEVPQIQLPQRWHAHAGVTVMMTPLLCTGQNDTFVCEWLLQGSGHATLTTPWPRTAPFSAWARMATQHLKRQCSTDRSTVRWVASETMRAPRACPASDSNVTLGARASSPCAAQLQHVWLMLAARMSALRAKHGGQTSFHHMFLQVHTFDHTLTPGLAANVQAVPGVQFHPLGFTR